MLKKRKRSTKFINDTGRQVPIFSYFLTNSYLFLFSRIIPIFPIFVDENVF